MSSTKNDISLKKRILKKNQPFHYFFPKTYKLNCLIKTQRFRMILI